MQPLPDDRDVPNVAARVRQNIAPAAIGAVFLLYFGFGRLAKPTGAELFDRASWVFYHTLRMGGPAMAAVAFWSLLGQPVTLAVDAVVTLLIGALLILTGLAMAIGGGDTVQTMINVICGGMFITSGQRNGKAYRLLTTATASHHVSYGASPAPQSHRTTQTRLGVDLKSPSPFQGEGRGEGLSIADLRLRIAD